jgi:RNA polymerase-binding protein DksA
MASRTTPARTAAASTARSSVRPAAKKAAPAKTTAVKKATPLKKAPPATKAATAKKAAPAKKAAVKKAAPAKKAAPVKKAVPVKKAAPAKQAAGRKAPGTSARPRALVVREDESPWTAAELAAVRTELESELIRLREQIADTEEGIADLLRDSGDGAGDDQADAGTKTFEREHEMSLANNARDLLVQNQRALERLDDGTYGVCENCGRPIGKLRLQAFPRATLCLACKQAEERR